jgi:hypothetical protein
MYSAAIISFFTTTTSEELRALRRGHDQLGPLLFLLFTTSGGYTQKAGEGIPDTYSGFDIYVVRKSQTQLFNDQIDIS